MPFPKLTRPHAIRIARRFVTDVLPSETWFQQTKHTIKAVILYGSTAKGTNRPDSDIDLLVLMPLTLEERYTQGEYFYYYDGREINIVIRSIERLRRIAEEHTDTFQKEVFRGSAIIQDVDGEMTGLIERIAQVKNV
ncbi:MAG TPA: nucleotidyltransferase domain-containing protein [Candidatus Saccharimonadales bacterium]|nr:nucleotidyltransferase domain-containing protein [Candidatus Saccharimonadales bacterium]